MAVCYLDYDYAIIDKDMTSDGKGAFTIIGP